MRIEFPEPPTSEEDDPRCSFEEYWLVEQGPDGRIGEHKPFASGCTPNPPEGSWCGTAPSAKVEIQGVLAIVKWEQPMMRCASAFLSYGVEKVSLETFHSVYSSSTTYRSIEPGESTSEEWDWSSLRGALEWSVDADSFCPRIHRKATPTIPKLAIDDDFVNVGWTTVPMEACSTKFDDRHGVTLGGPRAKVALRAVVAMGTRIGTSDVLFVEVEPDPGTEIPPDAYLEVCASERPLSTGYCSPMPIATCQKFRFGGALSKGKLTAERSPNLARFKVPLPEGRDALTVAYEEPKTRRSIASSRIPRRDTTVMSTVFELGEELATCRMKDGALSVVREPDKL